MSLETRNRGLAGRLATTFNRINLGYKGQHALVGGGNLSFIGGNIKWTSPFLVMSSGKSTSQPDGYFQINVPASGTVIADNTGGGSTTVTANGIPMAAWDAIYYVLPLGSSAGYVPGNLRVVNFQNPTGEIPAHWILIAVQNNDAPSVRWGCGVTTRNGETWDSVSSGSALPDRLNATSGYQVSNFNNATLAGWWYADNAATNAPATEGFWTGLTTVYPTSGYMFQQAVCVEGTPVYRNAWRINRNGTWSPWVENFHDGRPPTWAQVTGKPSTFPPDAHTHTKSQITDFAHTHPSTDITGLGNSATRNVGTASGTVAAGDDSRLSDARTPTTHTHTKSQITDFAHTHPFTDVTGTATLSQLPTAVFSTSHLPEWSSEIANKPVVPTQAVAEAGSSTVEVTWTPQRDRQGIVAYTYSRAQVDSLINAHADQTSQFGKEFAYGERTSTFTTTNQTFQSASAGIISGFSCQWTGDGGIVEIEAELTASANVANNLWAAWFVVNGSVSAPGGYMNSNAIPISGRTTTIHLKRRFSTVNGTSYTITMGVGVVTAATLSVVGSSVNPMWVTAVKR